MLADLHAVGVELVVLDVRGVLIVEVSLRWGILVGNGSKASKRAETGENRPTRQDGVSAYLRSPGRFDRCRTP